MGDDFHTVSIRRDRRRSAWRSVLRRTWIVVLAVAVGGAVGWLLGAASPRAYQAQAVVTAVRTPIPKEDFDLAQRLFQTDAVLLPVIEELGFDTTPSALLRSRQLGAEPVSGGALEITARGEEPEVAVDLANAAARSFAVAMENARLGDFSVIPANQAVALSPAPGPLGAGLGAGAGLLAGLLILALLVLLRDSVDTDQDAAEEVPADLVFSAEVSWRRRGGLRRGQPTVFPVGLPAAIKRASGIDDPRTDVICTVLVERRRRGDPTTRAILAELGDVERWSSDRTGGSRRPYWLRGDDPTLAAALEQADDVLVIVGDGCRTSALRRTAEELLVAPEIKRRILVFVTGRRRSTSVGRIRPPVQPEPPVAEPLPTLRPGSQQRRARST